MPSLMPSAEIISQGDEVVTGQTVDTNAAWLSERLTALGFSVLRHSTVGDRLNTIRDVVHEAARRADLCVCTGGLGPTEDDLTAQAVAAAAGRPLAFDPQAMAQIEARFRRFAKPMPESNRKQAMLPAGATLLENRWGTAPGFAIELERAWAVFLPGVPREMKRMFEEVVLAALEQRFHLRPGRLVTLRTAGIGESALQQRIGTWTRQDVVISYRSIPPENQIKLRFPPGFPEREMRVMADELAMRIGASVFAIDGLGGLPATLPAATLGLLKERGETLAAAEWGGGGRLCSLLQGAEGASRVLAHGHVCGYGDRPAGLATGVEMVSETAARALAEDVRRATGASFGLGLTVASEAGSEGVATSPGTTQMALATAQATLHRQIQLGGDQDLIRLLAAAAAVDLLRRHVLS